MQATLRRYYYKNETIDKFQCPNCGKQQDHYGDSLKAICYNCEKEIELKFKNIRRKNF